jgi:hypothetical protein
LLEAMRTRRHKVALGSGSDAVGVCIQLVQSDRTDSALFGAWQSNASGGPEWAQLLRALTFLQELQPRMLASLIGWQSGEEFPVPLPNAVALLGLVPFLLSHVLRRRHIPPVLMPGFLRAAAPALLAERLQPAEISRTSGRDFPAAQPTRMGNDQRIWNRAAAVGALEHDVMLRVDFRLSQRQRAFNPAASALGRRAAA